MQLETIQNVAMVPVRGTVYIVKLPFVCVWKVVVFLFSCVYAVVLSVVSVPVYYVKKACNRLSITWNWTKLSVRQSLGFSSRTPAAITDGTQTQFLRDHPSEPVSGHPSQLALRDDDDPFLDSHYGAYQRRHSRRRSRRERKAMITHLLRLLLEPSSPVESDEESERASIARAAPEQDEAEKALKLILDLVKLSKSQEPVSGGKRNAAALKPEELEAILCQARDREQLQALITELDQLAIEVAPDKMLKKPVGTGSSGHPSPTHTLVDSDRPSSTCSVEPVCTPNPSSIVSSSDEGVDPIDDDEQFHDVEEHPGSFERHVYKHGTLSPVQESPEYLTASSESLKLNQLEDELTKALSNLSTATSELEADRELVESMETEITQKTVTVTETVVRDSDLESVPKTAPSLGVQVGHERRDLANARKPRPPSRRPGLAQNQASCPDQREDNAEGDLASDSSDSDDEEPNKGQTKGGRKRTIPPKLLLTDQIHLLTSNSPISPRPDDGDEDEAEDVPFSQTDGPKKPSSDSKDTPKETQQSKQDSSTSDAGTMKLTSSQPLWMDMRRKRTDSSSSSVGTPTSTGFPVVVYTPPPRKNRALSDPQSKAVQPDDKKNKGNIWDSDPALDNGENLYDTLAPKPDGLVRPIPAEPLYLHERIALRNASSVEPSPRLPPRNNLAMKRTSSAETVSKPEKPLQRRGSERQSSASKSQTKDKESQEKSRDQERSRDTSRDHHERSRDSRDHHERSRDRNKEHRDRSRDGSRDHHERSSSRDHHERSRDSSKEHRDRSRDGSRDHERSRDSSRDHHERSSSKEHRERSRDGYRERSRDGSKDHRERTRESDRSRDRESHRSSRRDESTRESRSREKESHHSRSREKERRVYRSHSAERSRSRSEHRHSSDRHHHRSRSGDRLSSHSTERHSSSHRHSSSDRHRSHSSHNNSSATSSPDSKSTKEGEAKSKTLASPFSSKGKLASLFSRSSTKDSPKEEKQKKASSTDKEKKSRSASSKSKSSDKTSSRTKSSPDKDQPSGAGRVVSSASMSSLRSADVGSVYSFDSAISKNTNV